MQHNIQPLLNKKYTKATKAKGIYIFDDQGKPYLDGSSGAITCALGHSHDKMISVMKSQLDRLQYVYRSQFASNESERLAESLCDISPFQHFEHSFFVNSGSEAIETAMKIALQYWQELGEPDKTQFIKRKKSYHGITLGALSVSGHATRRARFETSLHQYATLEADLENDSVDAQMRELKETIHRIGAHRVAAFVAEPIVGAAGTAICPPYGYYQRIREICDAHQILFIVDEVMTGIGRTGQWFGLDHWSANADLIVVGKSLGAGYAPIAAVLMPVEILDPIKRGSGLIMSGHTYSGHPLSCAAANQVIEIIKEEDLIGNVNLIGDFLKDRLKEMAKKYDIIHKVRGKGLLLGIELDVQMASRRDLIIEECFTNGLLVYPSVGGTSGKEENGILVAPPYIINKEQTQELMDKLTHSFDLVNQKI